MDIQTRVLTSILVLLALVLLMVGLRRIGLIKEAQGPVFATLVTHVTLPALIFVSLAQSVLHWKFAWLALIMVAAEITSLSLAWVAGKALRLSPPQMGAMLLVAGFGSSSLLGYALISQIYGTGNEAIAEAAIISELGVGPALFTLGTMIALYYGTTEGATVARMTEALKFFRSPIFVSVVAGLLWSILELPTAGSALEPWFQAIGVLGSANTFAVVMAVGLLLHFEGMRSIIGLALLVIGIKLILQPILVWLPALGLALSETELQVLVLEAAMPSALLTVVLASSYGCDAKLASKLVFATTLASCVTAVTMLGLLG